MVLQRTHNLDSGGAQKCSLMVLSISATFRERKKKGGGGGGRMRSHGSVKRSFPWCTEVFIDGTSILSHFQTTEHAQRHRLCKPSPHALRNEMISTHISPWLLYKGKEWLNKGTLTTTPPFYVCVCVCVCVCIKPVCYVQDSKTCNIYEHFRLNFELTRYKETRLLLMQNHVRAQ